MADDTYLDPAGTAQGVAVAGEAEKIAQRALFARVMFLVGVTCAFAAAGAWIGRDLSGGWMFAAWGGALVLVLASAFIRKQSGAVGMTFLFLIGLTLGVAVGPILTQYANVDGGAQILWQSAGATALFVAGFGAWGYATRRDLAPLARIAFFALLGLIVFGIALIFVNIPGGRLIYAILGLAIFAVWTMFDFQRLRRSNTGAVAVPIALGIFLDVFNIFLFFLQIFGGGGR